MWLMINISDNTYNSILHSDNSGIADFCSKEEMMWAIRNGIQLNDRDHFTFHLQDK